MHRKWCVQANDEMCGKQTEWTPGNVRQSVGKSISSPSSSTPSAAEARENMKEKVSYSQPCCPCNHCGHLLWQCGQPALTTQNAGLDGNSKG